MFSQGRTSLVAMLEEGHIQSVAADTATGLSFLCAEGWVMYRS